MAVKIEIIGQSLMPVATLGHYDTMIFMAGRGTDVCNALVIANMPLMPKELISNSNQLNHPIMLEFRNKFDIDKMIKDLEMLKQNFKK